MEGKSKDRSLSKKKQCLLMKITFYTKFAIISYANFTIQILENTKVGFLKLMPLVMICFSMLQCVIHQAPIPQHSVHATGRPGSRALVPLHSSHVSCHHHDFWSKLALHFLIVTNLIVKHNCFFSESISSSGSLISYQLD